MHLVSLLTLLAVGGPGEYRDLFNGKDLDGWVVEGPREDKKGVPNWAVKDGIITCRGKGFGFLRYDKQQFGDFRLRVEYRFQPPAKPGQHGNSGIGIRTPPFDPKHSLLTRASFAAYEIQLLDDAGQPPNEHSTGSLYRYKAPRANVVRAAPEWNTLEVECVGPRLKVRMNGQDVLDADQRELPDIKDKPNEAAKAPAPKDKPLRGYVALQSHSGPVEFRRVQILELGGAAKE